MPAEPITPVPRRPSDRDRESTVRKLRDRAAEGHLSLDTYARRIEQVHEARDVAQLADLMRDLPPKGRLLRFMGTAVSSMSALSREIELAWWRPRVPRLSLPHERGVATVGRANSCDVRIVDPFVSRTHAIFERHEDGWIVSDQGSVNGTRVNGIRVTGPTPIRQGDVITLGRVHLRVS